MSQRYIKFIDLNNNQIKIGMYPYSNWIQISIGTTKKNILEYIGITLYKNFKLFDVIDIVEFENFGDNDILPINDSTNKFEPITLIVSKQPNITSLTENPIKFSLPKLQRIYKSELRSIQQNIYRYTTLVYPFELSRRVVNQSRYWNIIMLDQHYTNKLKNIVDAINYQIMFNKINQLALKVKLL